MVDLDAALGEQLLEIPVGESEPQVLADRQHDHLWWEPEPREHRRDRLERHGLAATRSHPDTLAAYIAMRQRNRPFCTHLNRVTWSTSTPRSASNSLRSRYERPNRRYQRTASRITSDGNRKPTNDPDVVRIGERDRRRFIPTASLP